jgi:hypothetical protein
MTDYCSNCPVWEGECPNCGTFWIDAHSAYGARPGTRYGIRPTPTNAWAASGRDTRHPGELTQWPNVVVLGGLT